jgi:hypothetical protein
MNCPLKTLLQIILVCFASRVFAQKLPLPPRANDALDGDVFIQKISALDLTQRDEAIAGEFLSGNAPHFFRKLCAVNVTNVTDGKTNIATFFAAPDYLSIGADENYFLAPVSPGTAQRIADKLDCILPTRKMVDAIYAAAKVKLTPLPIPPTSAMTTVPVFAQHNETVRTQRAAFLNSHPPGALVAGHQKDVVISARLTTVTNKVAIYGWHQTNGVAIQPLYLGHTAAWVDYSQCIRLISQTMLVNGEGKNVTEVLADPKLCGLISDEGVVTNARYPTNPPTPLPVVSEKINLPWPQKFSTGTNFGEMVREIQLSDEVRMLVNAPARESFAMNKPVLLVFYALPNRDTIEQTIGKTVSTNGDWHFNIQHIAAQTRWLRQVITNKTIVVAYLEAGMKSWPAWRKKYSDARIAEIFDGVRGIFSSNKTEVVLASHSGGGSLIFGYLNAVEKIPADVKRLAFLDSNYAYTTTNHAEKIKSWLAGPPPGNRERNAGLPARLESGQPPQRAVPEAGAPVLENHLCVLAYQDYLGLLNGKPFVSEAGGTWGRSQMMLGDLKPQFSFTSKTNDGLETFSALNGRIEFLLKENPEHKIFHTVQVERNGFIHALLSGTADAGKGYDYFGERAYTNWVR